MCARFNFRAFHSYTSLADIQALTQMLAERATPSIRSPIADSAPILISRPPRADIPWSMSSFLPLHTTLAPETFAPPVPRSLTSSTLPLSPLTLLDFSLCDSPPAVPPSPDSTLTQAVPRASEGTHSPALNQPLYAAGDATYAGAPAATFLQTAGQDTSHVDKSLDVPIASGISHASEPEEPTPYTSTHHTDAVLPARDIVGTAHRHHSLLPYARGPVVEIQPRDELSANDSECHTQAHADPARLDPPDNSIGHARPRQFYTYIRSVANSLYPILSQVAGESFIAEVCRIEEFLFRRPHVLAGAVGAVLATMASGLGTLIPRCGVLLASVTLYALSTSSPILIAQPYCSQVKARGFAAVGLLPRSFVAMLAAMASGPATIIISHRGVLLASVNLGTFTLLSPFLILQICCTRINAWRLAAASSILRPLVSRIILMMVGELHFPLTLFVIDRP